MNILLPNSGNFEPGLLLGIRKAAEVVSYHGPEHQLSSQSHKLELNCHFCHLTAGVPSLEVTTTPAL